MTNKINRKFKKYHFFVPELQYVPSKPLCGKCGHNRKFFRHKIISMGVALRIMFGEKINRISGGIPNPRHSKMCSKCLLRRKLTRHHLKNLDGKKNGKSVMICRKCHDLAEFEYQILGIAVPPTPKGTKTIKNPLKIWMSA